MMVSRYVQQESRYRFWIVGTLLLGVSSLLAEDEVSSPNREAPNSHPPFEQLKVDGAKRSRYRKSLPPVGPAETPQANLVFFREHVGPALQAACVQCHGPDTQEGNLRLDVLDPDLFHGADVSWWLEVLAVLSNGEMPPPDEAELADEDRAKIIEWLSTEIQLASASRRAEGGHTSFRRMARYEYNYALQDLLGLPWNFAKDLPPESTSEDGFKNSSETLHMSAVQLAAYRAAARKALRRATVLGDKPAPIHWSVSMKEAAAIVWAKQDEELEKIREKHAKDPATLERELAKQAARFHGRPNGTHYKDLGSMRTGRVRWSYGGARYAWTPSQHPSEMPQALDHVVVIPPRQQFIFELGDRIPEDGTMRVRIRAARTSTEHVTVPSLQLEFGWQASNDSSASVRVSEHDLPIDAPPGQPRVYQWEIPLSEVYPRNSVRHRNKLGDLPNPSEFIKFVNATVAEGDVEIDHVEVTAPVYENWPPPAHGKIFARSDASLSETEYARDILKRVMRRAWRRHVEEREVNRKVALFSKIRPAFPTFEEAMIEVLSSVLSSPSFLYLVNRNEMEANEALLSPTFKQDQLATRLAMFLWCSIPDDELLELAAAGRLRDANILKSQVKRMLADPRSERFSKHFVRQWLGMQLLDYLDVDRKAYPQFDSALKEAMQAEPIAFFHEVLKHDRSVLDFIHADYTMANERMAKHYGIDGVHGNELRRVSLEPGHRRGGLLTQSGLLAMNSDGKDSHPLKRGIWLLERLLNDPPPPPPPAVPEIDLADPEIAKLTLKQRIEDHRNDPACLSCHAKIDPWGIAFENFDAVGGWRSELKGEPVDATSQLFNGQKLDGMDGLKRFLLNNRQDQFVRSLVHKMTTYALGRPLTFGDRSRVDQITAELRQQGDGLATMAELIVTSELFQDQ